MTTKTKKQSSAGESKIRPSGLKLYRKIAITFIVLTVILLVVVFYFTTSKAKIIITLEPQEVKANLIVEVMDQQNFIDTLNKEAIKGIFIEREERAGKEITATGVKTVVTKLEGKARIINNSSKNQVLVATTRLLNKDNILFRIKDRVYIPADSSLKVDIYADDPESIIGEILPGKWTIPGLWPTLQEVIYAETDEVLTGGDQELNYVTANDLSTAAADMLEVLLKQADASFQNELETIQLQNNLGDLSYQIINDNVGATECDAKEGDEKGVFSCSIIGTYEAIVFQKSDLEQMVQERLNKEVAGNLDLVSFNNENYSFSVESYNEEAGRVNLKVSAYGLAAAAANSNIVNIEKIIGLDKGEAINQLESEKYIREADIIITPFWLKKLPKAKDKISVEFK